MSETERKLADIEQRLGAIEAELGLRRAREWPAAASTDRSRSAASAQAPDSRAPQPRAGEAPARIRLTTAMLMAIGASISFLLAAAYFVLLAIEHGWLTPMRQLLIAAAAGIGLVGGGLWLATRDRIYAAYLPAVGVGVLYLTVYAGHLLYELIPTTVAFVAVGSVSLLAIWLGRHFENSVYTLIAAVGVYMTPLLIRVEQANLVTIVIYFSAWSLLFSFLALQEARRLTYLVALYLALLCFDATWRLAGSEQWAIASLYQLAQFLIFVATAAVFGVRHQQPMHDSDAVSHGLPLLYFYAIEYALLRQHAPDIIVPAGLGSVVVIVAAYWLARARIADVAGRSGAGGLVSTYASLVTAHMVYGELLPERYFAWGALLLPVLVGVVGHLSAWSTAIRGPILFVSGLVFISGFLQALIAGPAGGASGGNPTALLLLYALALYASYFLLRKDVAPRGLSPIVLYLGHLAAMVASLRWLDSGLAISATWAVLAVALLFLALRLKDKHIGQSSLFVFTASALKVLLFDLADSGSTVRILSLIILGASLYAGGWLYQGLASERGREGAR